MGICNYGNEAKSNDIILEFNTNSFSNNKRDTLKNSIKSKDSKIKSNSMFKPENINLADCVKSKLDLKDIKRENSNPDITSPTNKKSNNDTGILAAITKKTSRYFDKSNFINMKNQNLFSEYQFCDRIGEGAYGYVYKTMHKKLKYYRAIKALKKVNIDEETFFNEINILKTVDHPNIIKLFELYYDSGFYYLIEEYCSVGDLYDYIRQQKDLSEKKVAKIMNQLLLAVNHLHSKKIVHRDLKPENIVFIKEDNKEKNKQLKEVKEEENIHIKIIDFGTSTYLKENKLTQELGTIYYIAPEVFMNDYDEKCDIWSCGIILHTLLIGRPPFRGNKEIDIKNKILNFTELDFSSKEWKRVSNSAKDFVISLLSKNPSKRPTAGEALTNEWLKLMLDEGQSDNILDANIMQNLIKFHSSIVLQKAVLSFLTNQADNRDLKAIREEFDKIDKNKDGVISKAELAYCLSKLYPEDEVNKRVDEVFAQVDFNHDNTISFSEFVTVSVKKEKLLTKGMLQKAFELFDLDRNGFIEKEELDVILPNDGEDDAWDDIIKEIDKDGDGKINFEEFVSMMELYIKQINN